MPVLMNHHDLREHARRFLPRGVFEYIDRGTEDEHSLRALPDAWQRWQFEPNVVVDVSQRDTATTLFGRAQRSPVVIAPTAMAGLVRFEGEVLMAQAAARAGVPFCVATQSITPIERIVERAPDADIWFQLYHWEDRGLSHALVQRAKAAKARVLVLTVDTVISANREYNIRNGYGIPLRATARGAWDVLTHPHWMFATLLRSTLKDGVPSYAHYPPEFRSSVTRTMVSERVRFAETLNWSDIAALRRLWDGPFMLKGVLRPDDAKRAADAGVDGLVVSSHGARNVDAARPSLDALPDIVDAVGHRLTVMMDSGVRRGSHIATALALGAKGVMVGRMPLWGMAANGVDGAAEALEILRLELLKTMALTGRPRVGDLDASLLRHVPTR